MTKLCMAQNKMKSITSLTSVGICIFYPIPHLWNTYISSSENSKTQIFFIQTKNQAVKFLISHLKMSRVGMAKAKVISFLRTYTLLVLWKKEINTKSWQPELTVPSRRHCRLIPISDSFEWSLKNWNKTKTLSHMACYLEF